MAEPWVHAGRRLGCPPRSLLCPFPNASCLPHAIFWTFPPSPCSRIHDGRRRAAAPAEHPQDTALPHVPGTPSWPHTGQQGRSRTRCVAGAGLAPGGGTRGQGTPPPLTPAPSFPPQSLAPMPRPCQAPVPEPSRRSSRDCGTWQAAPPLDTSPPCPSCLTRPPCCKDALHLGGGWIVPGGPRTPQSCPMAPGVATDPMHWAGLWERGPSSFGVGG